MNTFFRFPSTPHLAWLGTGRPRDDKLLDGEQVAALLAGPVVVEEKVDGANLGFSTNEEGDLLAQNRGSYLTPTSAHSQFRPLWDWLATRRAALVNALWPDLMLFGEWCYAVHSIEYDRLPDWFVGFDVFDSESQRFWDTTRRNRILAEVGLHPVPRLAHGHFSLQELVDLLTRSRLTDGPMEGIIVRRESEGQTSMRAKLVRADFTQAIDAHWSRGRIQRNHLTVEGTGGGASWL